MSAASEFTAAVRAYAASLLAATPNPADAVAVLSAASGFAPAPVVSASAVGAAQRAVQSAVADLCRRSAVAALARAASVYQPSSYDDAEALRTAVCALLDAEIDAAGDAGRDRSFLALKSLRAAVARDLTARGAALAPLRTVEFKASLPALTVAYRLYGDIARADQLIASASPPHPAFMPARFKALAS